MLQGAFADIQQLAHITIVQPVRVLAFLSECLVAAFRKAQDFIPKLCPIGFRNDVIVHNHILLLFIVCCFRSFLFPSAKVMTCVHLSKPGRTTGKDREE
jgi:hypothetical protein